MSHVWSDLRHGLRVLLRTPLFTICTIAALAVGIGSTTALFSVVHAMLVKPLPYPDADRLVVIWEHNLPRNRPRNVISPANFLAWRERSRSFEGMAAFTDHLRLCDIGVSLGDVYTLVYPRPKDGGIVRVSVGCEDVEDILEDFRLGLSFVG